MQELYNLSMMSPLIILCPWMTIHHNSISRTELFPWQVKMWQRGKNYKNIVARVMNLVHDTSSHQGLSIYIRGVSKKFVDKSNNFYRIYRKVKLFCRRWDQYVRDTYGKYQTCIFNESKIALALDMQGCSLRRRSS